MRPRQSVLSSPKVLAVKPQSPVLRKTRRLSLLYSVGNYAFSRPSIAATLLLFFVSSRGQFQPSICETLSAPVSRVFQNMFLLVRSFLCCQLTNVLDRGDESISLHCLYAIFFSSFLAFYYSFCCLSTQRSKCTAVMYGILVSPYAAGLCVLLRAIGVR